MDTGGEKQFVTPSRISPQTVQPAAQVYTDRSYPKFPYSPLLKYRKTGFKYYADKAVTVPPHTEEKIPCLSVALSVYSQSQIHMALTINTR
jgi:hypothetical protein